ncbi:F-box protein At3g26010 isoform X2 [Lactuca sativa]|uniref:F-box protein At3g26010 isoform X1 n=1 Tax=Lactuca sativa TaxID=4236 RepID=UPI000CCA3FD2|nr:F-box protein At3g26010 isoform X1 [Lactuca sativa]XP_023759631.1 F-box protein At3g26010 isoform X2 [Lactuca sativa]
MNAIYKVLKRAFAGIFLESSHRFRKRRGNQRFSDEKSAGSCGGSMTVFDKLTDELLIEILIRLPQKQANICKCVSIRFRSLISRSYFIRRYVNYHQNNNCFGLYYQSQLLFPKIRPSEIQKDIAFGFPMFESPGFSLSFIKKEILQFLASNNGLVLCSAPLRNPIVYFVCNPLTKQWIPLPPPPTNIKTVYIGFICNPRYSCNDDDERGSFKVVRIEVVNCNSHWDLSDTLKLEIFCSVLGRWREEYFMSNSTHDHGFFCGWDSWCPSAVVCDGLLYWNSVSNSGIFCYDPYNGECRTIKLPHEIRNQVRHFRYISGNCCLGEYADRLRYFYFSRRSWNYRVWELKNGGGCEWLLLHEVELDEMKCGDKNIDKNKMGLLSPHPLNQDILFFWCPAELPSFTIRIVEYDMEKKLLTLPCLLRDARVISFFFPLFSPFVLPCWPTAVPPIQQHGLS